VTVCLEAHTANNFDGRVFCEFDTVSLAPIQRSLINLPSLTFEEREWLDGYHCKVRELLLPMMREHFPESVEYLERETQPL